ncbi:MAG: PQQ-like beta-propeller repeat protein [Myxococcaceae bacterium]|nr:PQQ-like beta-propeller repeat protein [Myxococcaceae bacterium]
MVLLLMTGCSRPSEQFKPRNPCSHCDVSDAAERDACIEQCLRPSTDVRSHNSDLTVTAPKFSLFYDDLAEELGPLEKCGSGPEEFGGLKPLWRRALPAGYTGGSPIEWAGRSGVSVSHGRVAAVVGLDLWLFDARTGELQNAFQRTWRRSDIPEESSAGPGKQFAAFGPDGDSIWVWANNPSLLDLKHIDPVRGPRAVFAAAFDFPGNGSLVNFDNGFFLSPAVARDGTFYWQSPRRVYAMATGRHLEVDLKREPTVGSAAHGEADLTAATRDVMHATVKWDKDLLAGGRMVVGEDDVVYFASGTAVNPDGTIRWQAPRPEGWQYASGATTDIERPGGKRSYLPMIWNETTAVGAHTGRYKYVAHSLVDGSPIWSHDLLIESAQDWVTGNVTAQGPDGTLYMSPGTDPPPSQARSSDLEARSGGTGDVLWRLNLPPDDVLPDGGPPFRPFGTAGGPIPAPNGDGVYIASNNCKLYHVDRNGQILRWFRMAGRPVWDMAQVSDGVLYLVAAAPRDLDGERERWCPGFRPNGAERYQCLYWLCGPCVNRGSLWYLYAFQIE